MYINFREGVCGQQKAANWGLADGGRIRTRDLHVQTPRPRPIGHRRPTTTGEAQCALLLKRFRWIWTNPDWCSYRGKIFVNGDVSPISWLDLGWQSRRLEGTERCCADVHVTNKPRSTGAETSQLYAHSSVLPKVVDFLEAVINQLDFQLVHISASVEMILT